MSGPWDNYASAGGAGPWARYAAPEGVTADNVVRSLASGASFGLADEIAAAGDATLPFVKQGLAKIGLGDGKVSEAPDWSARYTENLARERGQDGQFAEQHPYVDMGAKAVGGIASTVAALPAAATSIGPNAIANVAKATGVGAGLGAAGGFGEGEGLEDRASRAAIGGTLGAALGIAQRPLAAVGHSIAESAAGRALSKSVAESGAYERIATALQRSKKDVPSVEMELARLGPEAVGADVSPELLQLAVNTKTLPGETRQIAQDLLAPREGVGRIGRTGERMAQAAEGAEPPPSHFALRGEGQAFDQYKRGVGQEAYAGMRAEVPASSAEMEALKQVPAVRDAIAQIEADAANTGTRLEPIDLMHRVKQKLNDTAQSAFASGRPINKADVRDLAANWEQAFWKANPAARTADQTYAKAASLPDYYDAGASLFTKGLGEKATGSSAPAIADLLNGATQNQALAGRSGATNAIRNKAQTLTGARGMARDIEFGGGEGGLQATLRALYPENRASDIVRQAKTEGIYANTSNRLLGGPHTADDLVGAGDLGNIAVRATPEGGIVPRITETAKAAINWVASPNEAVRNQIGKALLDPNPANQKKMLEMIAEILAKRGAGMPLRAGLSEAAGAAGGNY